MKDMIVIKQLKFGRSIKIYAFVLLALFMNFCAGDSSKNKSQKPLLDEYERDNFGEMDYFRFPSPAEIFYYVQESDIEYMPGIINDYNNHSKYLDSKKQALNLGVYISDLAYLSVFKRLENSNQYLNAIHKLATSLRIESAFSNDFLSRVNKNLNQVDSLVGLSDEAYKSIVNYLEKNNKESTMALLSIGTYIESLYLSFSFINNFENDQNKIQKIADQKYAFENLYNYIVQYLDKEQNKEYIAMINDIKQVFDKIEIVDIEETGTSKTTDGKLVLGGGQKLKMSSENYKELNQIVFKYRNQLIDF